MTRPGAAIGMAWYLPDQWSRWLAEMDDTDVFEKTHADWLALAAQRLSELHRKGIAVQRVSVDIDRFKAWCTMRRAPLTSGSRSEYVADLMRLNGEENEANQ